MCLNHFFGNTKKQRNLSDALSFPNKKMLWLIIWHLTNFK